MTRGKGEGGITQGEFFSVGPTTFEPACKPTPSYLPQAKAKRGAKCELHRETNKHFMVANVEGNNKSVVGEGG